MKKIFLIFFVLLSIITFVNAKGTLQIKSNISDAFVYVDGKKKAMIGEEYAELYLKEGEYLIEIKKNSGDGTYIHKGAKMVFVGDNTKTKINIKTKKIFSTVKKIEKKVKVKKANVSITQKGKEFSKMLRSYYNNLNKGNYYASYEMHTNKYKKEISYNTYEQYWKNSIKKIRILNQNKIYNNLDFSKLTYKFNIAYTRENNTSFCNEETTSYIYTNKWNIGKTINKKCKNIKKTIYSANGTIKIETPPYYSKNKSAKVKVTMTSHHNLQKGGVTVSFLNRQFLDIKDNYSTFDTTKHYKPKSKMWNKKIKQSIQLKNDVFEGWTNNWGKDKTKVLSFTIKPKGYKSLLMRIRGIQIDNNKKEYPIPTAGYTDEQGYNISYVSIPYLANAR